MAKLFLINKGELNEIKNPVLSTGDVYLLDDDKTIYVWIGSKSSVDEKTTGAANARKLDQERGGAAKIITIDQGQESQEFLKKVGSIGGGALKVVEQNIAKTMLKDVVTGDWAQFAEHKNVLYRVSSEEFTDINAMKWIQVPFNKSSLDSEDCFVADLGNKVYIWQGKNCNVKEKVKSGQWARQIDAERAGEQNEKIFEEGNDALFISALEKGEDYKESDAVQLRAESVLEPETEADKKAAAIKLERKAVIKDAEAPKVKEVAAPKAKEVVELKHKEVAAPKAKEVAAPKAKEVVELKHKEVATPKAKEVVELKHKEAVEPKVKKEISSTAGPGFPGQVDESIMSVEKVEGRRKCPKCGNEDKGLIHESIDKTNIILDYPRMYGKKYRCGNCGTMWREK